MANLNTLTRYLRRSTQDIIKNKAEDVKKPSTDPTKDELDALKDVLDVDKPVDPAVEPGGGPSAPGDPRTPNDAPPDGSVPDTPKNVTEPVSPLEIPSEEAGAAASKRFDNELYAFPVEEKITPDRNINIQRHHQGGIANKDPAVTIENMEDADDIGRLLTAVAREDGFTPSGGGDFKGMMSRTETMTQVQEILGPVFKGEVNGKMSQDQLFAARRMMATLAEDIVVMSRKLRGTGSMAERTPEALANYMRKLRAHMALQKYIQGNVREAAQVLSSQRAIAQTLRGDNADAIVRMIYAEGVSPETIIQNATAIANRADKPGSKAGHAVAYGNQDKWRTRIGAAADYFKNNILSGQRTHYVNTLGNAILNAYENGVVYTLAGGIGALRKNIPEGVVPEAWRSGDNSRVYLNEQLPVMMSSFRGLWDGMYGFGRYLATGKSDFANSKVPEVGRIAASLEIGVAGHGLSEKVAGRVESTLTGSFRALGAEDEFFKVLSFRQGLTRLSERQARNEGLTGNAASDRAWELFNNPTDEIFEGAMKEARNLTLTEPNLGGFIGKLSKYTRELVASTPWLGFIIPFTQTPANLLAKAVDMSALAVVSPRLWKQVNAGGAERDIGLAKITLGISQTVLVHQLYEAGIITGSGPEDPVMRRHLEQTTGWKPYAVKMGDKYYSLARLDPFAMSLAPVLALMDGYKYAGERVTSEAFFKHAIFSISEHALDKSWMTGLSSLQAAISGNEAQQDRMFGNIMANMIIPYASAVADIQKLHDPQERRISRDPKSEDWKGLVYYTKQQMKKKIPGYPGLNLRPSRMWDGNRVLPQQGPPMWMLSPVARSTAKKMDRASEQLFINDAVPQEPSKTLTYQGASVSILEMDNGAGLIYDAYVKRVGAERRKAVEDLISQEWYQELEEGPGGERANEIRRVMIQARKEGEYLWRTEDLAATSRRLRREDPESFNELVRVFGDPDALDDFIDQIDPHEGGRLPKRFEGKVRVRGVSETDALPLPQQVETGGRVSGPRF